MKKYFYIALSLIIASCDSNSNTTKTEIAQNPPSKCSDLQAIQLKGKVKKTRSCIYKNAILKDGIWSPSDTATYLAITVFYNETGCVSKQIDSSFDNGNLKYTSTRISHYNESNSLTSQEINTSPDLHFRVEYTYPEPYVSQSLIFNEQGKMTEKFITKKDSNCVISHVQNYHYDASGKLVFALQTNLNRQQGILLQERAISINEDGSEKKDDIKPIVYNHKALDSDKYNPTTLVAIPESNVESVTLTRIQYTYY